MPPEQPPSTTPPPSNFWGDTPEEQYYASHGVRNTKSYFQTPHGQLFTQSFIPVGPTRDIRGTVFMTHGYTSDTGWSFQKICMNYAGWGYAVFAADLLGHGRSDGIRGYVGDLNAAAAAALCFFRNVRGREEYRELPAFLFGESLGGLVTLLMYFQSEADLWSGLIFSAPLFVIPEPMKPSQVHLFAYGLLFGLAETWAAMPDNKMIGKAIRDPEKLKIVAGNPRRYTGKPRVGTMREIVRQCEYVQNNFDKVTIPFLTLHGMDDGVTCPSGSKMVYEMAKSEDKTLKLYEGMYHSLVQGEPDESAELVLADMRAWIDDRADKYGKKCNGNEKCS
ncbi:hypothetical protein ACS0TY_012475 [Phlomoides rotata]